MTSIIVLRYYCTCRHCEWYSKKFPDLRYLTLIVYVWRKLDALIRKLLTNPIQAVWACSGREVKVLPGYVIEFDAQ